MTNLSDSQQDAVRQWASEGCGLSEIQKRLREQFDIKLTYMDVRFLVIDLGIVLQDKTSGANEPELPEPRDENAQFEPDSIAPDFEKPGVPGEVSVGADRVVRPGAVASGDVTFSDGRSGKWMLDQMGRLALDMGDDTDYRPTPADIQAFQQKLQAALSTGGF